MLLRSAIGVTLIQILAVTASAVLQSRESFLRRYLSLLVSLAVGVLLATALLHLLPEAVATLGNRRGVWLLLGGTMIGLFALEQVVATLTGTGADLHGDIVPSAHSGRRLRPLNLVLASSLHSFVDGAAVTTAFAAGPRIGWLTTLAVALHEIPHRTGDFALLVHLGVSARNALRLVLLAGVPALLGVLTVSLVGLGDAGRVVWLLPVSAGSFLYIATVNLMPEIEHGGSPRQLALDLFSLALGVGLVVLSAGAFET